MGGLRMIGLYDIHCHLLPGVDDGSKNMKETIQMLKMEYEQGVRGIFATPHYRKGMFETSEAELKEQFELLRKEADKIVPGMEVYLGCEFFRQKQMNEILLGQPWMTMGDSRYVLTEFQEEENKSDIRETVCELLSCDWIPILAHVERYACMRNELAFVEELSELGVCISVNADSILGKSGFQVKRFCKKLIDRDLLMYIGSDAHGSEHRVVRIGECAKYLERKYGSDYVQRIMVENPKKIVKETTPWKM